MSYDIKFGEKTNILLRWLPGISLYKNVRLEIDHSHDEIPSINQMNKEAIILLQEKILSDLALYESGILAVERLHNRHYINQLTATQINQLFHRHINSDKRVYELAKEVLLSLQEKDK